MLKKIQSTPLIRTTSAITLLTLVAGLFIIINFYMVAFLAILLSTYLILPGKMSTLSRLLISYALFYTYTLTFAFIYQVIDKRLSLVVLLATAQAIILLISFFGNNKRLVKKPHISAGEIVVLAACMAGLFAIVNPIRHQPLPNVVKVLATGEDNASHLALYNSFLQHGKSAYFGEGSELGIFNNLVGYPQGMHINMAVNSMIVENSSSLSLSSKILDYAYQSALYYVFLIACFAALALEICRVYKTRSLLVAIAALSVVAWHYFIFGNGFILYNYGFQTQIFAYSLLALIAIASLYFTRPIKLPQLIVLGLLCAALSSTWFFLLPVAILYLVMMYYKDLPGLLKNPGFYGTLLLCGGIALIPVLASHASSGNSGSINLNGAVYPLTTNNLIICALALLAAFYLPIYKQKAGVRALGFMTLSSLIFSLLIAIYQWISIGELRYYFHKSLYIFPLLAAVALFVSVVHFINGIDTGKKLRRRALILLPITVAAASLAIFTGMPRISRLYLYEHYMLLNDVDTSVIQQALDTPKGHDVLMYTTCNPGKAYINQRWVGSLLLNETDQRYGLYSDILQKQETTEKILSYTTKRPSTILYNPSCASPTDISKLKQGKSIAVKPVEF